MKKAALLFVFIIFCWTQMMAHFIPNYGQYPEQVLYQASFGNTTCFIEKDGITIVATHPHDLSLLHDQERSAEAKVRQHAFKIDWQNSCFGGAAIETPSAGYMNYIGGNGQMNISRVPILEEITLSDVWEGVSIRFYLQKNELKYDFKVQDANALERISIGFEGLESLEVVGEDLHLHTSVGTMIEKIPLSYWSGSDLGKANVSYELGDKGIGFQLEGEFKNETLVIDPELVFASYIGATNTGSNHNALGCGSTFFPNGDMLVTSMTIHDVYPITEGVYLASTLNTAAIGVSRFESDGLTMIWSTIVQGGFPTPLHELASEDQIVLIADLFYSIEDDVFPITLSPLFEVTENQQTTMAMLTLTADGTELMASRCIGNIEEINFNIYGLGDKVEASFLPNGNLAVVASSIGSNFPTTPGVYQEEPSAQENVVVFEITPDLEELVWSTYLGGDQREFGLTIEADQDGSVLVGGLAHEQSGIFTEGAWIWEDEDMFSFTGFIARIQDGQLLQCTAVDFPMDFDTFFGNNTAEIVHFLELDNEGNVWAYGPCFDNGGDVPISEGAYANPDGSGFVCKFSPDLSTLLLSSRIGFDADLRYVPSAFMIDNCGYIYTSAHTATTGLIENAEVTEDAVATEGGFYIAVYEPDMQGLHFASVFGGDHIDGSHSNFDKKGVIYQTVCVPPYETGFFTTPGVWAEEKSVQFELGAFKIDLESPATTAVLSLLPTEALDCPPYTYTLENFSTEGEYTLIVDGQALDDIPSFLEFASGGIHEVELAVWNETTCNQTDTAEVILNIPISLPAASTISVQEEDPCMPGGVVLELEWEGTTPFLWEHWEGTSEEEWIGLEVTMPGEYTLSAIALDTLCGAHDTTFYTYEYHPLNEPLITADGNFLSSTEGLTYQWYLEGEAIEGATSQEYNVTITGNYSVEVSNEEGCVMISVPVFVNYVTVSELDLPGMELFPNPMSEATTLQLDRPCSSCELRLFNSLGQEVYQQVLGNRTQIIIPRSDFASGHYTLQVSSSEASKEWKLLME